MKTRAKYQASLASLTLLLFASLPAHAASFDVAFYELTEQATFEFTFVDTDGDNVPDTPVPVKRTGEGALAGEARLGRSPLCPKDLVEALIAGGLAKRGRPCYVTATGKDVIDLTTYTGSFEAAIQVKVQGDNPVDAPELVVLLASIKGTLLVADPEFRLLAIRDGVLSITHVLDPASYTFVPASLLGMQADFPTTGMVRLPFVRESDGRHRRARRHDQAFYLSDRGRPIPVKHHEHSLGVATARFELNFDGAFPGETDKSADDQ
jgi:hypothetical protein